MGDGKRRRDKGNDLRSVSAEIVQALNTAAGKPVWFNMKSGISDDEPAFIYQITYRGRAPEAVRLADVPADSAMRREVVIALLREQRPWIGAVVIDATANYDTRAYAGLGSWASDVASPFLGVGVRIPTTSMIIRTAWPEQDAVAIRGLT